MPLTCTLILDPSLNLTSEQFITAWNADEKARLCTPFQAKTRLLVPRSA